MNRILLVFGNAFRGILHARSLYLWIVAILVVGIQLAPQIIFRDNLPNFVAAAGRNRPPAPGLSEEEQKKFQELQQKQAEAQFQRIQEQFRQRRPQAFSGGLNLWTYLSIAFGILLGANALASEVAAKTIITVLARPISRWELLLGKWLAIQVFGVLSILVGVGIHLAAGWYLDIHFNHLLGLALLPPLVSIMLYSAVGIAVGTLLGSMVAAGLTVVYALLPTFVPFIKDSKTNWIHLIGVGVDYLVPPGFHSIFVNAVDATAELDRSGLSKILMENLLFCAIFFVLACVIFSKREVRLG